MFAGSDKPQFDDERRLSHDHKLVNSKESGGGGSNHSSVMEEATENDLQVSVTSQNPQPIARSNILIGSVLLTCAPKQDLREQPGLTL